MNRISWKEMIVGTLAGLSVMTAPAIGKINSSIAGPEVRVDNRGPGSLNSGPGSMNSGRDSDDHGRRHGKDHMVVTQATDVRQEDRRADRQMDRRADRREDRQADRREDHRSNAGGELRGLDRANHVAGERGRDGRDNARTMQMERPNRPERMERPERPDHQDRPDRAERPERGERH